MNRAIRCIGTTGLMIIACGGSASADVLHDTFGPGDGYLSNISWQAGYDGSGTAFQAMSFNLGAGTYQDLSLTLPLTWRSLDNPDTTMFDLKIYANDGTTNVGLDGPYPNGPGTELASVGFVPGLVLPESIGDGPWSLTTFELGDLVLSGNTQYWVAIESEIDGERGVINWYQNPLGIEGEVAQRVTNFLFGDFPDDWFVRDQTLGALRVEGTLVPVPGTLACLASGGLMAVRRRR